MKKIILFVSIIFISLISLASCKKSKEYDIISTSFAGYDFARGVIKDKYSTGMLLKPGEELHDYSPSVSDIENIINSKIFIYIGGESDSEWVENDILPEINKKKTIVINMMDVVKNNGNLYNEEDPNGEDDDEELDEHIWNSITNAKLIVEEIYQLK